MKVNKTEEAALVWLYESQGYKKEDIMRNTNTSPDFVCADGKTFEVKRLYGNQIIFYSSQIASLSPDTIILVFKEGETTPATFLWKDRKSITHIKINIQKRNVTTVSITAEQEKWLEDHHISLSALVQSAIDKEMLKVEA